MMLVAQRRFAAVVTAIAAVSSAACFDNTAAPFPPPAEIVPAKPGTIELSISTTGVELDPDGYVLYVTNRQTQVSDKIILPLNGTHQITGVEPGEFDLQIGQLSGNCVALNGGALRRVTMTNGATIAVSFAVACAESGTLELAISTTGVWPDPDGYRLDIALEGGDLTSGASAPLNGTARIATLLPGTYKLTLSGISANCEPTIPSPQLITVTAGSPTSVSIDVTCVVPTRLAFVGGEGSWADIYSINSDGTMLTQLTSTPGADIEPAWSSDGSKIAFTSDRDGNWGIYVMDADGENVVRLTDNGFRNYHPAWSPDGRIAFVSERDGNAEIYVMDSDGKNLSRLTTDNAADLDPAWSPDGSTIAFRSKRTGNGDIYTMNADGSGLKQLTNNLYPDAQPGWSPDGKRITFAAGVSGVVFSDDDVIHDIYTMNADGSDNKPLQFGGSDRAHPAWSPDGRKVAYVLAGWSDWDGEVGPPSIEITSTRGVLYSFGISNASQPAWQP